VKSCPVTLVPTNAAAESPRWRVHARGRQRRTPSTAATWPCWRTTSSRRHRRTAALKKLREGFVAPAQQIIENAKALFNPALTALVRPKRSCAAPCRVDAGTEEDRRRGPQKAEAEERARRQEAERIAAAARAKAEEEAAEARRKAQAPRARLAAGSAGNGQGGGQGCGRGRRAGERAAAVVENAEVARKAADGQRRPGHPGRGPEKVGRFALRDNWVAEFDLPEDRVLLLIVAAIAGGRTDLAAC